MVLTFDFAQTSIAQLVKHFKTNLALYRAPQYKEAQARQEFIDKMFVYLGWDVYNDERAAPQYREVEVEPTQDVEGEKRAPDYVFRIGSERKFFVEAKKPGVSIKSDARPAYQVRRYAWSAKLPLSLLTDFEELAVYDCRTRPFAKDQPSVARINFYTFEQYPDRWRDIWEVFSREAVRGGSFDQYVEQAKGKRGTTTVDAEFLKEIEGWRETLARNIALRNPWIKDVDELNDAVQRTIDRIIFLRMAEDRGIEAPDRLRQAAAQTSEALRETSEVYANLLRLFQQADAKYNSGLFDFSADHLTGRLTIDDKVLKPIIADLYYPNPYEFSVMPAEILGNVYEQFLGKVIRLTAAHQAKVEEKPEVKKAGGVYYTPSYIVAYIVQQTVGIQIEGRTPRQLESFRVLDMACGSGSFLLGAYQFLLDYYAKWYLEHEPQKHPKAITKIGDEWRLTTAERKRILLAHIYGVDIDRQAVEVTKLSLLLKVLEGENQQSLQMELFARERALPNLDQNIKCGNSLIGPDYFDPTLARGERATRQLTFDPSKGLDPEEYRRVNPFDWRREFPEVFAAPSNSPRSPKARTGGEPAPSPVDGFLSTGEGWGGGGFDCIIGNPPYGASFDNEEASYFKQQYQAFGGVKDVYVCFMELGTRLTKSNGRLSFIVPSAWLGGPEYGRLRKLLLGHQIDEVMLLPFDVFADAYVDTAIFVISNSTPLDTHEVLTHTFGKKDKLREINLATDAYSRINQNVWQNAEGQKFVLHLGAVSILGSIYKRVKTTFADGVRIKRGVLFDKELLTKKRTSSTSYRYFEGDVYRYELNLVIERWIEFDDRMKERPKEFDWFVGKRLLLRRLVNRRQRLMATMTDDTFITNKNLYSVLPTNESLDLLAILGVLNSIEV